jgi:hypothetical protein
LPEHFDGIVNVSLMQDVHRRHQQHEQGNSRCAEDEISKKSPTPED